MRYRTRVAIQEAVEVRDPAAGMTRDYETVLVAQRVAL
jgi:hypothetical protein